MKSISLILLFSLFYLQAISQNIKHITVEDGLPQSFVTAIEQDNNGFIWISTHNGLTRYDGNNFKIFQHDLKNKNSLSSNIIDYIQKSGKNILWIKYENNEIDKLDLNTQKIEHVINSQTASKNHISIHRNIWLITSDNFLLFKTDKNELIYCNLNKKQNIIYQNIKWNPNEKIINILEDKNKNIWVLTPKNLKKFNIKTQNFTDIPIPYLSFAEYATTKLSESIAFKERKNGEILWADNNDLYIFSPSTKKFRTIKFPISSKNNIKYIDIHSNEKEFFIAGNTVYSYDSTSGIKSICNVNLKDRPLQAFIVDKSGLIWISPDTDGVYTIDTSTDFQAFKYKNDFILDLLENVYGIPSGKVFFGWKETYTGVLKPSYYLRSLSCNNKNWIALNRTVFYYDISQQKVIKLPDLPKEKIFTPINGITLNGDTPFVIDKLSNIYFYDQNKWNFFYSLRNLSPKIKITNFYLDPKTNYFWITTESHGLLKLNLFSKHIQQITNKTGFIDNQLITFAPDLKNNSILWIGSMNGLIQFNKITNRSVIFSTKEGLPDNVIYSLLIDKLGNLWMGTNKGLVKFDTKTYKSRIFTRNNGLENVEFNRYHQLLLPNGKMAFGGTENGIIFDPEKIKQDTFSPATAITHIIINNNKDILEDVSTDPIQDLHLKYSENTISISYTVLQYNQPKENLYKYRLKGYQNNWIFARNQKDVTYTKLSPGNYTFEVDASNTDGKWSNHIKSLSITISSPWWETWWAIIIYIFLIGSCIFWFIKFKINQEVIKNEIKLKQQEAQELQKLDKIKTRFFSNIAHEFRTPLSLILGPAEQLKDEGISEERTKLYNTIKSNTNNLIQLTDQLIDIAKLEAGVLSPQMVWGDIITIVAQVVDAFSEEANAKKIILNLQAPNSLHCMFSINTIDRILYNLLSNSLKFCQEGDCITIKLSIEKGLFLQVLDTGLGIPQEEQNKIFNRYFKGTNQNELQGNGIGLSLVKELVELHNGTIDMKSTTISPSGTIFSIWLPFEMQQNIELSNDRNQNDSHNESYSTILIVEDNKDLAQFLSKSLCENYNILIANNGQQALEIANTNMPDLIVSDVVMDGMDGFELCKILKTNININHIPIILLTAKADIDSKIEGLSYGANDYISKPFSILELKHKIINQLHLQNKYYEYLKNKFLLPEQKLQDSEIDEHTSNTFSNEFLNKIYEIIEQNLDDKNFSVDELADALSMSRTNLHRKVKTMFDIPTGEIIKNYRLKRAAELLKKNYNVSEVAYMTGFNTPSYFTKCFKEYFGNPPSKHT